MTDYKDILQRIYSASNDGLEIIIGELPQAAVCRENVKKKFKLRNENDASACLRPPTATRNYWGVCDYGGAEGERFFSPIDIVMREQGLNFNVALQKLAEEWGVNTTLSQSVNKPIITSRPAVVGEEEGQEKLTLREKFSSEGLAVWGRGVTAEILELLGWREVEQITYTRKGFTYTKTRTEHYPIFRQRCNYKGKDDEPLYFDKVYEPLNYDKQFRFHSIGEKPRGYIFGLDAVIKEYQKNESQKLDCIFLVSGGSDAVACWSRDVPAVYMGSERDIFGQKEYKQIMTYCNQLYNVPDIDTTGIDEGKKKALELPYMKTIWLDQDDMSGLHDKRGGLRKDLKDFLDLHQEKDTMSKLKARGQKACFWYYKDKGDGEAQLVVSPSRLSYFLWLHGFCTLCDDTNETPIYLQFNGIKVRLVTSKTIRNYLFKFADKQGWFEELRDKLSKSHDLPTEKKNSLREIANLNILQANATTQPMFFSNSWIMVTKDGIERHSYKELSDKYIWEKRIIPHNYRECPKMFEITQDEKGDYHVDFPNGIQSKLMQVFINTSRLHWRKKDELDQELTDEEKAEETRCLVSRIANAGYILHIYKSLSAAYATVCVDYKMGENQSEKNGRTGKSVYWRALGQMVNYTFREAKRREEVESRFFFGGTTEENGLFVIDECHENFDIGQIFGRITGDFLVEQKNQPIRTIPFNKSPKLGIATNSVIKQHDQSTEGRLWYQVFSDYYHVKTDDNDYTETRTIYDDIGCNLMDDEYPEEEWQADIAFLVQCLQYHLSLKQKEWKIDPPMAQIRKREQQASISKSVKEWAEEYFAPEAGNLNRRILTEEVYNSYIKDSKSQMSPRTFTVQLKAYCKLAGLIYNPASITKKGKDGERIIDRIDGKGKTVTFLYIQPEGNIEPQEKQTVEDIQPKEEELPFCPF